MSGGLHKRICGLGVVWARREGFGVVASEIRAAGCGEEADVVAFRSTCSLVMEAKVSRRDFLADAGKPHRTRPALGNYRFYVCPEGIIQPDELPVGWGLLYMAGRTLRSVIRPPGNLWPGADYSAAAWDRFKHPVDQQAERAVLYSIARRLAAGKSLT